MTKSEWRMTKRTEELKMKNGKKQNGAQHEGVGTVLAKRGG
jgi:hypothetical protein